MYIRPTMQGRIQDFWKGGVQARIQDFSQAPPPPLDIVRVTSSDLRKFEKHPTLGHSQAPPPLDIVRVTSSDLRKIWKTPPLLDIHKRGGSNFGPNVKKPTSWPKRGGSGPPGPPPLDPPLPWEMNQKLPRRFARVLRQGEQCQLCGYALSQTILRIFASSFHCRYHAMYSVTCSKMNLEGWLNQAVMYSSTKCVNYHSAVDFVKTKCCSQFIGMAPCNLQPNHMLGAYIHAWLARCIQASITPSDLYNWGCTIYN